jgi:hypothetical protein
MGGSSWIFSFLHFTFPILHFALIKKIPHKIKCLLEYDFFVGFFLARSRPRLPIHQSASGFMRQSNHSLMIRVALVDPSKNAACIQKNNAISHKPTHPIER